MSKEPAAPPEVAPEDMTPPQTFEITLDDFCRDLSREDSRVELIGGFHFDERTKGHVKDTKQAFSDRYAAFAGRPVKA